MLFNSFTYALFLPLVFLLYWLPPVKPRRVWQNGVLLVASYVFYGAWDWRFLLLIAITSLSSWGCGMWMEKHPAKKRQALILNLVLNLGILAYFKYAGFFVDSFCALLHLEPAPVLHIILPVGISFYTFQAIGYTVDVYRGTIPASRNMLRFFAFVSFFPQLVAGPIERAKNLLPQFDTERRFDYRQAVSGLCLILWGLALKLLLADRLAVFVDAVWKHPDQAAGLPALVAVLFFAFQLYADFYAYSEIARGSARLLGMELMVNFRRPYLSSSFKEFWKRWHISLSSWFGDYVYIPLGGNRKGTARRWLNVMVVFLLSGLWHGASWTFVAWGACCALCMLLLDKPLKYTEKLKVVNPLIVFACWAASLVLFRAGSFESALQMFASLGFGHADKLYGFGLLRPELLFAVGLIVAFVLQETMAEVKTSSRLAQRFLDAPVWLRVLAGVAVVLILIFLGRYGLGSDSRFIYFQF